MPSSLKHILASAALALCPAAALALPAQHYAANSLLSSGRWVKIRVDQTGMQQLTYAQLRQWGFSNPSRVTVFGSGGVKLNSHPAFSQDMPDDLCQTPSMHRNSKLIFYGESGTVTYPVDAVNINVTRNVYDESGYYFLTDGQQPANLPTVPHSASQSSYLKAREHYHVELFQPDNTSGYGQGSAVWFGPDLSAAEPVTVSLPVSKFASSYQLSSNVYFNYSFGARTDKENQTVTPLTVTLPEGPAVVSRSDAPAGIPSDQLKLYSYGSGYAYLKPAASGDFENGSLDFGFRLQNAGTTTFAALKSAWLLYPRRNELDLNEPQLAMSFVGFTPKQIFSVTSSRQFEVWNVSDANAIYRYQISYSGGTGNGTIDEVKAAGARTVAFIPDGDLYTPELVGEVPHQNLHAMETPEMLVVTTDDLYEAACELAQLHRDEGRKVAVVRQSEVLNEFSSGVATPMAIRMMAKMFYDRDPQTFKYLLLYGPASWDYRRQVFNPNYETLLSFAADKAIHAQCLATNYTTDNFFAFLEDSYQHDKIEYSTNSIAVGRINVTNGIEARNVNAKIRDYVLNPLDADIWATAVMHSDFKDNYAHLNQSESVAEGMQLANPDITFHRYPMSLTGADGTLTTRLLKRSFQGGCGVYDMTGHGRSNAFTYNISWTMNDVINTRYRQMPIGIFATCEAFMFDYGTNDMTSQMMMQPGRGIVAGVGSCRKAYLVQNGPLNKAVGTAMAAARGGETLGDAYLEGREAARRAMQGNTTGLTNSLSYHLGGDPLMRLPAPDYTVRLTRLGACTDPEGTDRVDLSPLTSVPVAGQVCRADGSVATDFNGTAKITVYDAPFKVGSWSVAGQGTKTLYKDQSVLGVYGVQVTDGVFATNICLPLGQAVNASNRIVLSARETTPEGVRPALALGGYGRMRLVPAPDEDYSAPESAAPVIESMYINSPDFVNGSQFKAGTPLTLHLTASAANGVAVTNSLAGMQPVVVIDGTTAIYNGLNSPAVDPDGNARLSVELPAELGAGRHELTFKLADNTGRQTSRTITFTLIPAELQGRLEIAESPARSEATLSLTVDDAVEHSTLVVTDARGNSVFTARDAAYPYVWNLRDSADRPVADGVYSVSVIFTSPRGVGHTKPAELVVLH